VLDNYEAKNEQIGEHSPSSRERRNPQCNPTRNGALVERKQVERSLGDVAPQLATYVVETIYGEIYQNNKLDSRTRQIVTVAALASIGTAAPQLRTHIGGALRCGVTREELVEIMMQLVPYVGVAAAINGVAACREVFAAADNT
jgi:4-carboxymuconolactone decarboxylase